MMRTAISPRLATRTLLNIFRGASCYLRAAGRRKAGGSPAALKVFGATSRHASRICEERRLAGRRFLRSLRHGDANPAHVPEVFAADIGFWQVPRFTSVLLQRLPS